MFKVDTVKRSITPSPQKVLRITNHVTHTIDQYTKTRSPMYRYFNKRSVENTVVGEYAQVYCVKMWEGNDRWLKVGVTSDFDTRVGYLREHGSVKALLVTEFYDTKTAFKLEQCVLHCLAERSIMSPGRFSTECVQYSEMNEQIVRGMIEEVAYVLMGIDDFIPTYRDEEDVRRLREIEEGEGLHPSNVEIGDIYYKAGSSHSLKQFH